MKDFIIETIKRAGDEELMPRFRDSSVAVHSKGGGINDIMTEADLASQRVMVTAIKATYPDHHIVAEEGDYADAGLETDAPYTWFLDPIDGTLNFRTGVQMFGINIGVWDNAQEMVSHAAVYLPATDELCYAEVGKGATLNGQRTLSSDEREWRKTYGVGTIGVNRAANKSLQAVANLSDGKAWCGGIASPAVTAVWLAAGRRDWYISRRSKPWDYAAPSLIMSEAGCNATDSEGRPWRPESGELIVTNGSLDHTALLGELQEVGGSN